MINRVQNTTAHLDVINPLECDRWDTLIQTHPDATFFHSRSWASVLWETYQFRPFYFVAVSEDTQLVFLVALMEVNSWLTGKRGVSLPFTDHCAPLCRACTPAKELFDEVRQFGANRGWRYSEFRGGNGSGVVGPASLKFLSHSLRISPAEDALLAGFDSSTRRAIRKAEKSGLEVRISCSDEATREFYRLHCLTRKRHGLPPQPFAFFRAIQRWVLKQSRGFIVVVKRQGIALAANMFFHFGIGGIYKFGASDEAYQEYRASNLAMWRGIQELRRRGVEDLDFGRTSSDNAGLRRFKLGWGTIEFEVHYFKFDYRHGCHVTGTDKAAGIQNRIFRVLPNRVNRIFGMLMYKHVA